MNVTVTFGGLQALVDVHLSMGRTGMIALVGPNGAGKSTLFNVICGFIRPTVGRCYVDGMDVSFLAPVDVARLSLFRSFQRVRLVRQVSVLENVLLAMRHLPDETLVGALAAFASGRKARWEATSYAREALDWAGLSNLEARPAGALSYGEQKLLVLACAFASDAKVVLLDEPLAGIAPERRALVLERLKLLARDRLLLVVEHDLEAVRSAADRMLVLAGGEVIADGVPDAVLGEPSVVEAFIG